MACGRAAIPWSSISPSSQDFGHMHNVHTFFKPLGSGSQHTVVNDYAIGQSASFLLLLYSGTTEV